MIKAKIEIKDNGQIMKVFEPELKKSTGERASYKIKKNNDNIIFDIESKDFVALRAILNSITKLLEVNFKINQI